MAQRSHPVAPRVSAPDLPPHLEDGPPPHARRRLRSRCGGRSWTAVTDAAHAALTECASVRRVGRAARPDRRDARRRRRARPPGRPPSRVVRRDCGGCGSRAAASEHSISPTAEHRRGRAARGADRLRVSRGGARSPTCGSRTARSARSTCRRRPSRAPGLRRHAGRTTSTRAACGRRTWTCADSRPCRTSISASLRGATLVTAPDRVPRARAGRRARHPRPRLTAQLARPG